MSLAMIKAIQRADSLDRATIVAALPKAPMTGVTGVTGATRKIAFDRYGDSIKPSYTLFQVQQSQWKSPRTVGGNGV
jgi:branched-chain amino acid transport system substrate-binding protein